MRLSSIRIGEDVVLWRMPNDRDRIGVLVEGERMPELLQVFWDIRNRSEKMNNKPLEAMPDSHPV